MFKRITAIILVVALTMCFTTTAFATESTKAVSSNDVYSHEALISAEGNDFINKVVRISEYWYVDENNELAINLSEYQLKNTYGFSDEQYDKLMSEVVGFRTTDVSVSSSVGTRAHISGGALYITHGDLVSGTFAALTAAASVSPVALQAALVAISAAMGGPVGGVISVILTVIAAPSLVELAGRIVYAVATGQGIYIKPVLSYPPLEIGYW